MLGEIDGDSGSATRGDLKKSRVYDVYGTVRAEDAANSEGETGLIVRYHSARYAHSRCGLPQHAEAGGKADRR